MVFQGLLAEYQNKLCILAQEENALGRLLKEYGKQDKNRAGKMMSAVGKSLSYTAQQRVALRNPLVRLFQEVDTFYTRAVQDTLRTVIEMEKVRTEYRGALMWMKNISQDFNPDQYHQLEKFREVQAIVKQKKANFDKIKIKSLQKTDLLAASRCNMFSHALILYQNNLITFSEKTAKTLNTVANKFKGYQPYDFQIIKELAEPVSLRLAEEEEETKEETLEGDDKTFFNAEYHDDAESNKNRKSKVNKSKKKLDESGGLKSDSLLNLLDLTPEEPTSSNILNDKNTNNEEKKSNVSSQMDLLTNNPEVPDTEKDTQQMLKELFDSPVHQTLPVFGTDIPSNAEEIITINSEEQNPFQLSDSEKILQNPESMFLPSQLLDFGMQSWSMGNSSGISKSKLTNFIPQSNANNSLMQASSITKQNISTKQKKIATASLINNDNSLNEGNEASGTNKSKNSSFNDKLDWYKVFQDIDPLADPAGALFGKISEEEKQC